MGTSTCENTDPKLVCATCFRPVAACACGHGNPWNTVEIDEGLQDTIRVLNEKGFVTRYCCEGHGENWEHEFYIAFAAHLPQEFLDSLPEGFVHEVDGGRSVIRAIDPMADEGGRSARGVTHAQFLAEVLAWVEALPPCGECTPVGEGWVFGDRCPALVYEHATERPQPGDVDHAADVVEDLKAMLTGEWVGAFEQALGHCDDPDKLDAVLCGLAENPRISARALERLALYGLSDLRPSIELEVVLASNPATPLWALEELADDNDIPEVDCALLANPSLPKSALAYYVRRWDPRERFWHPELDPSASPAMSEGLVRELVGQGYVGAAGGPATPADVAEALAHSQDRCVRQIAARCPQCPASALEYLLQTSNDRDICGEVLCHDNLPRAAFDRLFEETLENEIDGPFAYLRLVLRPDATRQDIDAFLQAARKGGALGRGVADAWEARARTAQGWQYDAREDWDGRCSYAAESSSDEYLLRVLAEEGSAEVRQAVASNPATPVDVLERMGVR